MRGFDGMGRRAARWMQHFARAKSGNTAMIFAIASVSVLSAGGAGIDLARTVMVKTRLASALDAAALAVGTTNGLSDTEIEEMAQRFFDANYPASANVDVGPVSVSGTGQQLLLSVSGSVPTTLLQILDIDDIAVSVSNEVVRAVTKLRVALVLDVTGSMAETDNTGTSKISALKTATHQLLGQLHGAAINPGDVWVSIVPFSLDVNVGTANANATWIDWTDYEAPPPNSMPSQNYGPPPQATNSNCPYGSGTSPYGYGCVGLVSGKIPASGLICPGQDNGNYNTGRRGHTYNGCYTSVKKVASCTSNCKYDHVWQPPADHSAWAGCIMDRTQDFDTNNTTPATANPDSLFPAENNALSCTPATLMGLNTDWTALNAKVDQLSPKGGTNQTVGLAWGMQALSQGNPLNAPPVQNDPTIQNVIVLLSDGLNTQDRWYGNGSNHSTDVDDRMALACASAKAAKIRMYTVLVMAGNSSVLEDCASDSSKYFALSTAGALVSTFKTIGTELANLHLAH